MTVGFAALRADYDARAGQLAMAVRDSLLRVQEFKAHLDTRTDGFFLGLSPNPYVQPDIDTLRSAFVDLDQLRVIYQGGANLAVAKDFRTFAKLLTGVV